MSDTFNFEKEQEEFGKRPDVQATAKQIKEIVDEITKKAGIMGRDRLMEMGVIEKPEPKRERIVLMSRFTPKPYADEILSQIRFVRDKYNRFWRYDVADGIWKEDASDYIRKILREKLLGDEMLKNRYIEEIVSHIRDTTWNTNYDTTAPDNIIAFNNCLYNIDTDEIMEFIPKYFITTKIPIDLDPMYNSCDVIDSFFEECVGKENKSILYELIAYTLIRRYPYQKFFILFGKGQNGKSVYLNLIRKFLGISNVSSESPQNLVTNRFSRSSLWNKLANIGSDIPYINLINTNTIKELTGEDYTPCERKYRESFPFRNYAKLIWSANELPQVTDKTHAFYRRVYIIKFENEVKKPDPQLLDKITTKSQLMGLAWVCKNILKKLKENNYVFSINPSVHEMERLYEELSNPIKRFIRENLIHEVNSKIPKWEFKDRFIVWLRQNGFRIWSEKEIGHVMKELYPETRMEMPFEVLNEYGKTELKIKLIRAWDGLKWKESHTPKIDQK